LAAEQPSVTPMLTVGDSSLLPKGRAAVTKFRRTRSAKKRSDEDGDDRKGPDIEVHEL
jgi:hypothetical protein